MSESYTTPLVLPLGQSTERAIVGGKAAGLGLLSHAGFRVPPGLCLTTAAYDLAVQAAGLNTQREWAGLRTIDASTRGELLARVRERLITGGLPRLVAEALEKALPDLQTTTQAMLGSEPTQWVVRSSAAEEDTQGGSYGGLYHTTLGASAEQLPTAIANCWASLWSEPPTAYAERMGHTRVPTMAVLIQPLLAPLAAGVAYSRHPVTGDPIVVINAVFGLGERLVSGRMAPDQYAVKDRVVLTRDIADKPSRHVPCRRSSGLQTETVPADQRSRPALTDAEILQLAGIVRQVEQVAGHPIDLEWALCDIFYLLQSRPVGTPQAHQTDQQHQGPYSFVWSRANFMETLPELPSPLSLAFVRRFMEMNIVNHYRKLGCDIPSNVSSVRTINGRPYINVTLFQSLMAQLGGDPASITDQMGGEATPVPQTTPLMMSRLPPAQLFRALYRLQAQIWHAGLTGPCWFAKLAKLAVSQWDRSVEQLTETQLVERMDEINSRLQQGDLTFAIVSGVTQAMYVISATLTPRLTSWRSVLNAATQGFGTIISARQILWLQDLAELAAADPAARRFFIEEPEQPAGFRQTLAGSRFMEGFEAFLQEYGHRAVGESDVMSARFAETPEYLLDIIRRHLIALTARPQTEATARSPRMIKRQQTTTRAKALAQIRRAFGARVHEWLWFRAWYRVLGRFLALREANRHALMRYVAGARHLLQILGRKLSERGVLESAQDLFYLTDDELRLVVEGSPSVGQPTWQALVQARRNDLQQQAALSAPHTVWEGQHAKRGEPAAQQEPAQKIFDGESLRGLPLSAGIVEGPVRLVLTSADLRRTEPGDILVAAALDPGMAPVFGLAAGLIVEIGGLLSHGAIIAREYGIPAVANVTDATIRLKPGEWVRLDADRGEVHRRRGLALP